MNAMPAVGGVASVLGIKCVNLLSCACVYYFGEGGRTVMCKDASSAVEEELLEVADLRFDPFVGDFTKLSEHEMHSVLFSTSLVCCAAPRSESSHRLWIRSDQCHFTSL